MYGHNVDRREFKYLQYVRDFGLGQHRNKTIVLVGHFLMPAWSVTTLEMNICRQTLIGVFQQ